MNAFVLHRHCTMASICRKLERSPRTVKKWRRTFLTDGIASRARPLKKAVNKERQALIRKKKERLVKIIHEPPRRWTKTGANALESPYRGDCRIATGHRNRGPLRSDSVAAGDSEEPLWRVG
jgi:hypothetical protein